MSDKNYKNPYGEYYPHVGGRLLDNYKKGVYDKAGKKLTTKGIMQIIDYAQKYNVELPEEFNFKAPKINTTTKSTDTPKSNIGNEYSDFSYTGKSQEDKYTPPKASDTEKGGVFSRFIERAKQNKETKMNQPKEFNDVGGYDTRGTSFGLNKEREERVQAARDTKEEYTIVDAINDKYSKYSQPQETQTMQEPRQELDKSANPFTSTGIKAEIANKRIDITQIPEDKKEVANMAMAYNKEQTFADTLVTTFKFHDLATAQAKEYYKAMLGEENRAAEMEEELIQMAQEHPEIFEQDNLPLLKDMLKQSASLAPFMKNVMLEGIEKGMAGAIGAGGAAALLGQAGPQALLPEETFTVPGAAAVGFKTGQVMGSFQESFMTEAGFAFKDMVDNGMDVNTARNAAVLVGLANAGIEMAQVGRIAKKLPVVGKALTQGVSNFTLEAAERYVRSNGGRVLLKGIAEFGKDIAIETGQEIAQEIVPMVTETGARKITGDENAKWSDLTNEESRKRILDVATSTLKGMPIVLAPGNVNVTANTMYTNHRAKKANQSISESTSVMMAAANNPKFSPEQKVSAIDDNISQLDKILNSTTFEGVHEKAKEAKTDLENTKAQVQFRQLLGAAKKKDKSQVTDSEYLTYEDAKLTLETLQDRKNKSEEEQATVDTYSELIKDFENLIENNKSAENIEEKSKTLEEIDKNISVKALELHNEASFELTEDRIGTPKIAEVVDRKESNATMEVNGRDIPVNIEGIEYDNNGKVYAKLKGSEKYVDMSKIKAEPSEEGKKQGYNSLHEELLSLYETDTQNARLRDEIFSQITDDEAIEIYKGVVNGEVKGSDYGISKEYAQDKLNELEPKKQEIKTEETENAQDETFDLSIEQYKEKIKQDRPSVTDAYFNSPMFENSYKNKIRENYANGTLSDRLIEENKELIDRIENEKEEVKQKEKENKKQQEKAKERVEEIDKEESKKKAEEKAEKKKEKQKKENQRQEAKDNIYKIPKSKYVTYKKGEAKKLQEFEHRQAVEKAIMEGKEVPKEVLKDYPDLAKGIEFDKAPKKPSQETFDKAFFDDDAKAQKEVDKWEQYLKYFGIHIENEVGDTFKITSSENKEQYAIVAPSTRDGFDYQITIMDNNGPVMHEMVKTKSEIGKKLDELGYYQIENIEENNLETVKEDINKTYRYYTTLRPPSPGAVPRGFTNVEMYDKKTDGSWGYVEYEEPLSAKEIENYELREEVIEEDIIENEAEENDSTTKDKESPNYNSLTETLELGEKQLDGIAGLISRMNKSDYYIFTGITTLSNEINAGYENVVIYGKNPKNGNLTSFHVSPSGKSFSKSYDVEITGDNVKRIKSKSGKTIWESEAQHKFDTYNEYKDKISKYEKPEKLPSYSKVVPLKDNVGAKSKKYKGNKAWVLRRDLLNKTLNKRLNKVYEKNADTLDGKLLDQLMDESVKMNEVYPSEPIGVYTDNEASYVILKNEKDNIQFFNKDMYDFFTKKGIEVRTVEKNNSHASLFYKKKFVGAFSPVINNDILFSDIEGLVNDILNNNIPETVIDKNFLNEIEERKQNDEYVGKTFYDLPAYKIKVKRIVNGMYEVDSTDLRNNNTYENELIEVDEMEKIAKENTENKKKVEEKTQEYKERKKQQKKEEQKEAKKEAEKERKYNEDFGYTQNMPNFKKGKTLKVLNKKYNYSEGIGVMTRKDFIKKMVMEDASFTQEEVNNKNGYYVLEKGEDVLGRKITKTEYDYGKYLQRVNREAPLDKIAAVDHKQTYQVTSNNSFDGGVVGTYETEKEARLAVREQAEELRRNGVTLKGNSKEGYYSPDGDTSVIMDYWDEIYVTPKDEATKETETMENAKLETYKNEILPKPYPNKEYQYVTKEEYGEMFNLEGEELVQVYDNFFSVERKINDLAMDEVYNKDKYKAEGISGNERSLDNDELSKAPNSGEYKFMDNSYSLLDEQNYEIDKFRKEVRNSNKYNELGKQVINEKIEHQKKLEKARKEYGTDTSKENKKALNETTKPRKSQESSIGTNRAETLLLNRYNFRKMKLDNFVVNYMREKVKKKNEETNTFQIKNLTSKFSSILELPTDFVINNQINDTATKEVEYIDDYISVAVDYKGDAYVTEGLDRLRAAKEAGEEYVPVEIKYFDAGETVENKPFSPTRVIKQLMESKEKTKERLNKIKSSTTTKELKTDKTLYRKARKDMVSAIKLVDKYIDDNIVEELKKYKNAKILPIIDKDNNNNKIPRALAIAVSEKTGFPIYTETSKINEYTGEKLNAIERMIEMPDYKGIIEKGQVYILTDDIYTKGSTVNKLIEYIHRKGGKVAQVFTLANSENEILMAQEETLKNIDEKLGVEKVEKILKQAGAIEESIEELTEGELKEIERFENIDRARDNILEGRLGEGLEEGQRDLQSVAQEKREYGELGEHKLQSAIEFLAGNSKKELKNLHEIISELSEYFRVPVTDKNYKRRKALGYYLPVPKTIHMKEANDIDTVLHEFGHHIDHKYSFRDRYKPLMKDLIDGILTNDFKANYKPQELPGEAIAEFFKYYITNPAVFDELMEIDKTNAISRFKEIVETELSKNDFDKLMQTKKDIHKILNKGVAGIVKSQMVSYTRSVGDRSIKDRIEYNKNKLYTFLFDEYKGLSDLAGYVENVTGKELKPSQNPYKLMLNTSRASQRAAGIIGMFDNEKRGTVAALNPDLKPFHEKSFAQVLKPVLEDKEEFDLYLKNVHAIDLMEQGHQVFPSQVSVNDLKALIKNTEETYPNFKETSEELYEWWDDFMEAWLVKTGFLDKTSWAVMKTKYPHYVPMFRAEENYVINDKGKKVSTGKRSVGDTQAPIFRLSHKGNAKATYSPTESMVIQINGIVNAQMKREVMLSLDDLYKKNIEGIGEFFEKDATPMKHNSFKAKNLKMNIAFNFMVDYIKNKYGINEDINKLVSDSIFGSEEVRKKSLDKLAAKGADRLKLETFTEEVREIMADAEIDVKAAYHQLYNLLGDEGYTAAPIIDYMIQDVMTWFTPEKINKDEKVLSVIDRNNDTVFYRIHDENLLNALIGLSPKEAGKIMQVFISGKRAMTNLITSSNPFFGVLSNLPRDIQTGLIFGNENNPVKYARGLLESFKSVISHDTKNQAFKSIGGGFGYSVSGSQRDVVKEVYNKMGVKKANLFMRGMMAIEQFNDAIESGPRQVEFYKILNEKLAEGWSEKDALLEALYQSSDVTLNFMKRGTIMREGFFKTIPFFNAGLQGLDKLYRSYTNPETRKQVLAKSIVYLAIPTIWLSTMYKDDEDYKNVRKGIKDNYWLIKLGWFTDSKDWEDKFIRIPKPRDLAFIFSVLTERTMEILRGEDDAMYDLDTTFKNLFIPSFRTVFAPLIDVYANKNWFGIPIVPQRLQNLPVDYQYDDTTSNLAKLLAEIVPNGLGVFSSPKNIDYLLDQYLGVIGDIALPLTTDSESAIEELLLRRTTTDPVYSNDETQKFYSKLAELETAHYALTKKGVMTEQYDKRAYEFFKDRNSKLNKAWRLIREIQASEDYTQAEKDKMMRDIRKDILEFVKQTMETYKEYEKRQNN